MYAELGPFYAQVCEQLGWTVDDARLADMSAANKKHLEDLEAKITDAKENLGDTEVKGALLAKADYLCKIGVRETANIWLTEPSMHLHASATFNPQCIGIG